MSHEHWLSPARPSPWPGCVLCVSTDVEWRKNDGSERRETALLSAWGILAVIPQKGVYHVAREAVGYTAAGFWQTVREASLRTKNLWILGHSFRQQAAALELWQQMESGNVRIVGADWRPNAACGGTVSDLSVAGAGVHSPATAQMGPDRVPALPQRVDENPRVRRRSGGNGRGRTGGVCILEDPPVVIELKIDGGGSKITWVDAANYGIDIVRDDAKGLAPVTALADWFIHAASTLHSLGRCGWQSTAGSQAMHLFRSVYHETPTLCHAEPRATTLERAALFGGRCECFRLGRLTGTSSMYDIRSMYPFLMANLSVPVRLRAVHELPDIDALQRLAAAHWTIADVAIETDEPEYPYRDNDAVVYPVGRYWTRLCGEELNHALSAGAVRGVRHAASYETERSLERYARELYALRCRSDARGDTLQSAWLKRLMVALPGKFGQQLCGWEDIPGAESPWEWAEWWSATEAGEPERWRSLAWAVQRQMRGGFSHDSVPAITAAICAGGRRRLAEIMGCAGMEHVYYCDTDAVIVDDYGAESLTLGGWVRPGEWGFLQHVVSSADCEIFGVKHYRIGGRVRAAGESVSGRSGRGAAGTTGAQPSPRQSLRAKTVPADWRAAGKREPVTSRPLANRPPGGRVPTPEKWEW